MRTPEWMYPPRVTSRWPARTATRRLLCFSLAALVMSCGENITAPSHARKPTNPLLAGPVTLIMERTTDIAAHDGLPAQHLTSTETITGQLRAAPSGTSAPSGSAVATSRSLVRFDASHLPRPTPTLPARYEQAMCSVLPQWSRSMQTGGTSDRHVEVSGVGDAPASTLRIFEGGRVVTTVERTWTRTAFNWQLQSQVTTSADGRFRDVVTYTRRTATGQIANDAIPLASCLAAPAASVMTPALASRSYYAVRDEGLFRGLSSTGVARYATGDCNDNSGVDRCYDKQQDVYKAEVALAAASAAVVAACITPIVVIAAPCTAAGIAYAAALANLAIAQASLNHCREVEATRPACGCGANLTSRSPGGTSGTTISASRGSAGTTAGPSFYIDDCSGDGTGTGGSGGTGGGEPSCDFESWEISYDGGATWQFYGVFWTCYVQ